MRVHSKAKALNLNVPRASLFFLLKVDHYAAMPQCYHFIVDINDGKKKNG